MRLLGAKPNRERTGAKGRQNRTKGGDHIERSGSGQVKQRPRSQDHGQRCDVDPSCTGFSGSEERVQVTSWVSGFGPVTNVG